MGPRARRRWKRAMQRVDDLLCSWGRCSRCRIYDVAEGIGGKCINCGKVHGWVSRVELIDYADRDLRRRGL